MGHGQLWSCFASWACASFYRQERGREGSTGERRRVQVTRRPCMRRARDPTRRGGNVSAGVAHLADGMRAALHSSSQPAYVARSVSSPHSCACSTIEGCSADGCSQPRNAHAKPSGCKEARACSPMKAHNPKRSGDSAGCLPSNQREGRIGGLCWAASFVSHGKRHRIAVAKNARGTGRGRFGEGLSLSV